MSTRQNSQSAASAPGSSQHHQPSDQAAGYALPGQGEDLLRMLVERVEDYAMFVLDAEGRVATWNAGAERIKGYTAQEIVGRPYHTFFTKEDRTAGKPQELLRRARIDGRVEDQGWRVRKDGSRFWADALLTALYGAGGELLGYAKITRDLTERRAADEQRLLNTTLRELAEARDRALAEAKAEHALLEAVVQRLPAGVVVAEAPSGRLILRNEHFDRIWRRPFLAARSISEYAGYQGFHPDGQPYAPEEWPLARAVATGEVVVDEEIEFLRGDGTRGTMLASAAPIRDQDGRAVAAVTTALDITERRRAEAALRESEAKYRSLFTSLDAGFCVVEVLIDANGQPSDVRFIEANPALMRQTGVHEVIGKRMGELAPRHEAHWLETYARVALTGQPERFEKESPELGRWYEVYAFPIGEPAQRRVAILFNDVTARRQAELEHEQLLAAIAHDLRNPLTAIKGTADVLQLQAAAGKLAPDRLSDRLRTISQTATVMSAQIGELLDAARLRAGQPLALHRSPTDLVALAERAVGSVQQTTTGHTIHCHASVSHLIGDWDALRLERVLGNLLSNAVKYSPEGSAISVEVARDAQDWARAAVRDCGVGIPANDLPHIFERYHRAVNVVGRFPGEGIGLAGARQIVEQHGGTIHAESQQGQGSTFIVRLPLTPVDQQ